MRNRRIIPYILTASLIMLTLFTTGISANAAIQDYDDIGIKEGERYEWTLSDVDEDKIEALMGFYEVNIRDGKQIIYNIEKIIEHSEGFDDDNWTIEYERWNTNNEADDDGFDSYTEIYKNSYVFMLAMEDFGDSDAGDPNSLYLILLFIPKDAEDFLSEAASLSSSLSSNGLEITYDQFNTQMIFEYGSDGVLEKAEIKYDGDTCYILELTSSGPIPINWAALIVPIIFIGIISAGIAIPSVLLIKKRKKSISTKVPDVKKEQPSYPIKNVKMVVYCTSCHETDSITRDRFYYFTCQKCGKYSFNLGYLCRKCNLVYPISQLDFINLGEPDILLCYKCNNKMELLKKEE